MIIQRYYAADLLPFQEKAWKAIDGLFVLYADYLAVLAEKDREIRKLKSIVDSVDIDGTPISFASICDSIDSKHIEDAVYSLCIYHIRKIEQKDKKSASLTASLEEKENQITALQEREKVLVARLHTHGDVETDKEEALRGGEEKI